MRGGVAGRGERGGVGAKDDAPASLSWLGYASRDQGGAYSAATTRVHLAGVVTPAATVMSGLGCDQLQGIGAGQMLYAIPHYFERATRITRLVTRTNGTTGVAGSPLIRMGIWDTGTLSSSNEFASSPYPAARLAQSDPIALLPGANRLLETQVSAVIQAGTYAWFGIVFNADAVSNKHVIPAIARNAFFPILGWTFDATTPTTIAQDSITFGVGWRHAVTFVSTEDLPNPFPQSAPAALTAGAAANTINLPAIGFGRQDA